MPVTIQKYPIVAVRRTAHKVKATAATKVLVKSVRRLIQSCLLFTR
jgi:hypothetical protein